MIITLTDIRKEVGRELGMRKHLYPKWVEARRLQQKDADHQIACMDALYLFLKDLEAAGVVVPELKDALMLILYFVTREDRANFAETIQQMKAEHGRPMTAIKVP